MKNDGIAWMFAAWGSTFLSNPGEKQFMASIHRRPASKLWHAFFLTWPTRSASARIYQTIRIRCRSTRNCKEGAKAKAGDLVSITMELDQADRSVTVPAERRLIGQRDHPMLVCCRYCRLELGFCASGSSLTPFSKTEFSSVI